MRRTAALLLFCLFVPATLAQEDGRAWTLSEREGRMMLSFGTPESDDVMLTLSCSRGNGAVTVFVVAASEKLTPGETAEATLTIGKVRSTLRGGASVNMMDGIPSLSAVVGAAEPIFQALTGDAGVLAISVKGEVQRAPLRSLRANGAKFRTACMPQP